MAKNSKPLGSEDISGANFAKEMLKGDYTYAINFDRIQWDKKENKYVIVELLLCEEKQFSRGITPYSSHPNRYFWRNTQKFISLWELANAINANLFLVNYSKKGTEYEDEILLMKVIDVDKDNPKTPVKTEDTKMNREEFSKWFRELNMRGRLD